MQLALLLLFSFTVLRNKKLLALYLIFCRSKWLITQITLFSQLMGMEFQGQKTEKKAQTAELAKIPSEIHVLFCSASSLDNVSVHVFEFN